MKPLSELLSGLESFYKDWGESAYREAPVVVSKEEDIHEDDFIFGQPCNDSRRIPSPAVLGRDARPFLPRNVVKDNSQDRLWGRKSGVTYDPTHANWPGRSVISSWSFAQHSPNVISAAINT